MTIPTLSTSDKSFICSYSIGMNVDFRIASGVMNEITTYTTEYIEGRCWIPVIAPMETDDQSYFCDEPGKDIVYIKVGCRVSSDGYIHTWLMTTQQPSELILWNTTSLVPGTPINDTTVLHWAIEKLYRQVWGSILGFNATNIKFQMYNYTGGVRLYLFGSNAASTNPWCSMDPADIIASSVAWYPNNETIDISDLLTSNACTSSPKCTVGSTYKGSFGIDTVAMGTSPSFWYITVGHPGSRGISGVCTPGDAGYATSSLCTANTVSFEGIGNNSGRSYTVYPYGGICIGCANGWSNGYLAIDLSPNQAYIWIDSYCSGASGSGPTECAANGGTWVPGHYECNPSFTYDTSVSFEYRRWKSISPTISDFAAGRFYFSSLDDGKLHTVMASYTGTSFIDMFSEYEDDNKDWVKHFSFTPYVHITDPPTLPPYNNIFYSYYTPMIGIGIVTDVSGLTIPTSDWIITWSGANYYSSWTTPDGLGARNPGSTRTLLTRPLTHHDDFVTPTSLIEVITGGFLYELSTSNGFLSRDPGTETKLVIPISNDTDFNWLYEPITSNGFLWRDPGMETKLVIPISNDTDFNWLYRSTTSYGLVARNIDEEIKCVIPLSNDCEFSWLYKLIKPQISILYHLKTDGDDTKDGLSWDNAWKHWTYMAQNMPGDDMYTVLVEEGIYDDNETQIGPDNSVVVYLVKNGLNDISTVEVKLT